MQDPRKTAELPESILPRAIIGQATGESCQNLEPLNIALTQIQSDYNQHHSNTSALEVATDDIQAQSLPQTFSGDDISAPNQPSNASNNNKRFIEHGESPAIPTGREAERLIGKQSYGGGKDTRGLGRNRAWCAGTSLSYGQQHGSAEVVSNFLATAGRPSQRAHYSTHSRGLGQAPKPVGDAGASTVARGKDAESGLQDEADARGERSGFVRSVDGP